MHRKSPTRISDSSYHFYLSFQSKNITALMSNNVLPKFTSVSRSIFSAHQLNAANSRGCHNMLQENGDEAAKAEISPCVQKLVGLLVSQNDVELATDNQN